MKSTWTEIDDLRFSFADISREADETGNDLLVEGVETTQFHLSGLDELILGTNDQATQLEGLLPGLREWR